MGALGAIIILNFNKQDSAPRNITGTITAPDCSGGYNLENANVELKNESGELIGSASTGTNKNTGNNPDADCVVNFTIPDVPTAKFYQFHIGTHGAPSYSFAQMDAQSWHVDFTLS